ncbi:DUF5818 domain-containing protein [Sphingobium chlorophenolicum]|uniref:DUF5818 domain-containing protein n=1 Tax=Sphingobium chlorophenolicum TaxID=46429 RepID=UPI0012DC3A59|nr:DUF5818 domain-containing protein [Sphingobium chlorophenolicum]
MIELAGRGPVLIEPDGTRWRLAGEVKADDVVGKAVTIEGSVTGAVIDVYYLAPRTGPSTC